MHTRALAPLLVLLPACPLAEPAEPADESTSSTSSTLDTTTDAPTTTSPTTSTGDPSTTSTSSTSPAPTCPDGHLDPDELCDDGNTLDGDGCNNDCTPSAALLREWRSATRGSDYVHAIAVADDGILVGGRTTGLTRWVARFSPELALEWSRSIAPDQTGNILDIAVDPAGIHVAGSVTADDEHDLWVARLTTDGEVVWQDTVSSGLGVDYATRIDLTAEGDVIVAGVVRDPDDLTTLWTRRYTAGEAVWTASFPLTIDPTLYPLGPGLAVTADAVVLGWTRPPGSAELLLAYPLAGGDPLLDLDLPGTHGALLGLAADPGGDLLLTGVAYDADLGELVVRRTSPTGDILWSSTDCTGSSGRDIAVDHQGDIVVIGDGDGDIGTNIRLCKFSPDGQLRWGKDIDGGFGDDRGYAVAIAADDRVIAGGMMPVEGGDLDAWLAVYAP